MSSWSSSSSAAAAEEETGRDHAPIILAKNCDGGSNRQSFNNKGLKPLWPCRNIFRVVFSTSWVCGGVAAVRVLGEDDGFGGRAWSWDCGEVFEVVGGGLDVEWNCGGFVEVAVGVLHDADGLFAWRNWLLEGGDSPMRVEEVVIVLFSRLWRRVGVDAEWGIDSFGRSF